jgi:hypothetical protein
MFSRSDTCLGLNKYERFIAFRFAILFVSSLMVLPVKVSAQERGLSQTESLVVNAAVRGAKADLTESSDPVIRGEVLARILTGAEKAAPSTI